MSSIIEGLFRKLKQQPLLYVPYYYFRKAGLIPRRHLATREKDLCLEGYPSSGTSYFNVILHYLRPDLKIAHHTHSLANIRMALFHQMPVVVPIREPTQAVASTVVRFGKGNSREVINKYLQDYHVWYQFVLNHLDQICVVPFTLLVADLEKTLAYLSRETGLVFPCPDVEKADREARIYMKVWNREYGEEGKISLPSADREAAKGALLEEMEGLDTAAQALTVYQTVRERIQDRLAFP